MVKFDISNGLLGRCYRYFLDILQTLMTFYPSFLFDFLKDRLNSLPIHLHISYFLFRTIFRNCI